MNRYHLLAYVPAIAFALNGIGVSSASAQKFSSPDILVLGDSQLSIGSARPMQNFFRNFETVCKPHVNDTTILKRVAKMRTTMIGVRAGTLQSWVLPSGNYWNRLCRTPRRVKLNASVRGHNSPRGRTYVKIGKGQSFQFCKPRTPALRLMLRKGYYQPRLVLFYTMGSGAWRMAAENGRGANEDVRALSRLLPKQTRCVVMPTAPIYKAQGNRVRVKAQANLVRAFNAQGNRCQVITSLRPETINRIQGKARHFKRRANGRVRDPWHPSAAATEGFFQANRRAMCRAVASALAMPKFADDGNDQRRPQRR